jgi:hypothetical protein
MKYFITLTLMILFCHEKKALSLDDKLMEIAIRKNKIISIVLDMKGEKKLVKENIFRGTMLRLSEKIKEYKPALIYLDQTTLEKSPFLDDYEKKFNRDLPVISTFTFQTKRNDRISEEMKTLIGPKIKGQSVPKGFEFSPLTGIEFPYIEFIQKSKAICVSGIPDKPKGDYGFSFYFQYENYIFENCPITIANEFLSKYNLKLEFDWSSETPALYEVENGKLKLIKHIVSPEVFGVHYEIPFQFREFRTIDLNEFLEKDFEIEPGMIFIVSNSINEFQAANGEKKYPYQILPSEVYNLLDIVSQPLEKEK